MFLINYQKYYLFNYYPFSRPETFRKFKNYNLRLVKIYEFHKYSFSSEYFVKNNFVPNRYGSLVPQFNSEIYLSPKYLKCSITFHRTGKKIYLIAEIAFVPLHLFMQLFRRMGIVNYVDTISSGLKKPYVVTLLVGVFVNTFPIIYNNPTSTFCLVFLNTFYFSHKYSTMKTKSIFFYYNVRDDLTNLSSLNSIFVISAKFKLYLYISEIQFNSCFYVNKLKIYLGKTILIFIFCFIICTRHIDYLDLVYFESHEHYFEMYLTIYLIFNLSFFQRTDRMVFKFAPIFYKNLVLQKISNYWQVIWISL